MKMLAVPLRWVLRNRSGPGVPRFIVDRQARSARNCLEVSSQAHQRVIGIAWPRVDRQHIFHGGYERPLAYRGMTQQLPAMGLENGFFSARPIVESLARSTICSSTTFFSNKPPAQGPARASLGRSGTSQRNQFGFFLAVKNPCNRRLYVARCLRLNHNLEAFFHQLLPDPVNHRCAGLQRLDNPVVTPAFTGFRHIGLQQYPRLQQPSALRLCLCVSGLELLAFLTAQPHNILLYRKVPSQP